MWGRIEGAKWGGGRSGEAEWACTMARMTSVIGLWQLVAMLLVMAGPAPALVPATGSVELAIGAGGTPSHGWVVLASPSPKNEQGAMLAHIAPRSERAGEVGAADGVLFPAVRLERTAHAIAACDDRVYMFFDAEEGRDASMLEVLSVRAMPTPIAGLYAYEPQGRLEAHRSLPRLGGFVGAVGTSRGVAALVRSGDKKSGDELVLSLLRDGEWVTGAVPQVGGDTGIDLSAEIQLLSVGGEVWIAGRTRDGRPGVWEAVGDVFGDADERGTREGLWRFRRVPEVPGAAGALRLLGVGPIVIGLARDAGGTLGLWSLVGDRWIELGKRGDVPERFGAAWLSDVRRVVVVWESGVEGGGAGSGTEAASDGVTVWEVSASTGLVMHDGAAARRGPLSTQDFRALVVLLVGATTAVLLFVVRSGEDSGVLAMPPGVSLAAAGRRVAASAIDVAFAFTGVWVVSGATPGQVVDVLRLTPDGMGVMGLVEVVVFGFAAGTITEAAFGRTIGKVLTGCEALPIVGKEAIDRRGLGLRRAAMRNAVKWALPPAAFLGLFEPGGRHRGDIAAGTVVIERFDTE